MRLDAALEAGEPTWHVGPVVGLVEALDEAYHARAQLLRPVVDGEGGVNVEVIASQRLCQGAARLGGGVDLLGDSHGRAGGVEGETLDAQVMGRVADAERKRADEADEGIDVLPGLAVGPDTVAEGPHDARLARGEGVKELEFGAQIGVHVG